MLADGENGSAAIGGGIIPYHVDVYRCVDGPFASVYIVHMDSRAIIKALEADGWSEVARRGSHVQFKHPDKPGRVTVPHPKKNLPVGTLRSIEKQSGLKLR